MTEERRPWTPVATRLQGGAGGSGSGGSVHAGSTREDAAAGSADVRAEVLFRLVNEQIRSLAGRLGVDSELDLVCECADRGCFERLTVSVEEYDAIRPLSTRFIVKPDHAAGRAERVVEETARFVVVERIAGPR